MGLALPGTSSSDQTLVSIELVRDYSLKTSDCIWHAFCLFNVEFATLWQRMRKKEKPVGNTDKVEGTVKQTTGKIKEGYGDLTDDTSTEFEGKRDQVEGDLQSGIGKTRENLEDAFDSDDDTPR